MALVSPILLLAAFVLIAHLLGAPLWTEPETQWRLAGFLVTGLVIAGLILALKRSLPVEDDGPVGSERKLRQMIEALPAHIWSNRPEWSCNVREPTCP